MTYFHFGERLYRLPQDSSRHRYRAYSKYELLNEELSLASVKFYAQSKEYNNEDGGKPREFQPLEPTLSENKLFCSLINKNIKIAKLTKLIHFNKKVNIGLHQIRYCGSMEFPSYASPLWLHKDDGELVFIHLLNLSANAKGGDNLIAKSPKKIEKFIKLTCALDTLAVTKKHFHAVTPIGSAIAYSDILLVTFDNEKIFTIDFNEH